MRRMAKFDFEAHVREERGKKERELPGASSAFQTKRSSRRFVLYFNRYLWKPLNVVSTQVDVLAAVKKNRNAKIRVIAEEELGCAQSTLSRSLKRLVSKGLVEMTIGSHDKRQRWPKLTPTGEKCLAEAQEKVEEFPQLYLRSRLGPDMIKSLRTESEKVDRAIYDQIREERFCAAGLWDLRFYKQRWEGWSEEQILADHFGKPPPKKA